MHVSVIKKLKALASESEHIDLESFQFINLNAVKSVVGSSWPDMKRKIFDVSEYFIEKRVSENDIVIRVHDGFLIVFAHISSEKAVALGQILSESINRFFLGEESLKGLEVVSRHERLTADDLNEKLGLIIQSPDKDDDKNALESNVKHTEEDVYSLESILKFFKVHYYPVWDSNREIISSNSCIPHLNINGFLHTERDILVGDDSRIAAHAMDMLMIKRVRENFFSHMSDGAPYVMTVTVSCRTLMRKESMHEYFSVLSEIPARLRKNFLVCVDQIPTGIPQIRLTEIFRALKPLCGGTLAHTLPGAICIDTFEGAGPALFGFKMQDFLGRKGTPNDHALADVSRFCADAHLLKASVYVTGIEHVEHIIALRKAGIRYFIGPCIGHPQTEPHPLSTLHAKTIFQPPPHSARRST